MKKLVILLILALICSNIYSQDSIQKKLTVAVKATPPFIIKDGDSYKGLSIDLWNRIAESLNLEYEYKEFNSVAKILDVLNKNEIDICISPLTVSSNRLETIDFMQPFYITNLTIAIKRSGGSYGQSFFSIGLLKTVILLLIILIVLGFLLWISERKHFENKVKGGYGILYFILYLSWFKKRIADPISKAGGMITLLWGFALIFILSAYAVMVFFSMNVNKLASEITTVSDLSNYEVGVIKEAAHLKYFESNDISYEEFETMDELLLALTNDEVQAIVHEEPIIKFHIFENNISENFQILPVRFNTQYYSFAVPHKSELQYKVNPVLFKQIETDWESILENYNLNE